MGGGTHRRMKPTKLEWLSGVPENWEERPIGRETWVRARLGWKGLTANEYVDDGIPMLATPNIKGSEIDFKSAARITRRRYDESPEIALNIGDVLLTKDGSTIGTVNMVRELPEHATVNGSIAVITPNRTLSGRFLYWVLASQYAQSIFGRLRDGMGVPHLFQRDINRIFIPYPPVDEQRSIAEYLDRETQKIDELITEQRSLIEILKERREALIEQIVPLGLSDASLTESSVPWISRMPSHWNVARMKHDTEMATGGTPDTDDLTYWTEPSDELGVPWVAISDMSQRKSVGNTAKRLTLAGIASKRLTIGEEGTILFAMYASVGEVSRLDISATWNQAILGITPGVKFDSQYLAYSLMAMRRFMLGEVRTNTQANLSARQVGDMWLPCPPRGEQREIANYLDDQTSRIDELISESEDLIALSRERRAALITAAVTGQIDVRTAS